MNASKQKDDLLDSIRPIIESMQSLTKQAALLYAQLVDDVINTKSTDERHIEQLLDRMLDFCFDDGILLHYKKLCRYYFQINPAATAGYIQAYRELWDTDE